MTGYFKYSVVHRMANTVTTTFNGRDTDLSSALDREIKYILRPYKTVKIGMPATDLLSIEIKGEN